MSRRAFTLVEVLVATVVTGLVALAVYGTVSAVQTGVRMQDEVAQETARIARAQARLVDHLYRARMILGMSDTVICLWLPVEEFDGSVDNATAYDTIHGNELRWYVIDGTNRTVAVQRLTDQTNRTVYPLNTDWAALRTTLASAGNLQTSTVLNGVAGGAFRFEEFDPCATRRVVLDIQFDADHGGYAVELGGIIALLQRHPDCL